jgi:glycerate kinase
VRARYARRVTAPRVVIAPDKLKATLAAAAAARALTRGVARARPDARCELVPIADGGEGTLEALETAWGALGKATTRRTAPCVDPLGAPIEAVYLLLPGEDLALVELARASGLWRIPEGRRDPLRASTRGTGAVIRHALEGGARRVLVAVGGSASTDGGAGLARALGVELLDASGRPLEEGGGALEGLARVDVSGLDPRARAARVTVLADVRAPLLGPRGAARVFGPQKGATPEQIERLERGLGVLAERWRLDLGREVAHLAGAGSAGGTAAGLAAFLGATIEPGADWILRDLDLARRLAGSSLVVTAEGRLDGTSLEGKAVGEVLARAARARVPAAVVAGSLGPGWERALGAGAREVVALADLVGLERALREPEAALELAGERLARSLVP